MASISRFLSDESGNLTANKRKSSTSTTRSFRQWIPSMVAVAFVVALNAFVLGPTGHKIPVASPGATRHEIAAQIVAKLNESNVDGYTRRRHRNLGKYAHRDVSSQFSPYGKVTVTAIYLSFWVFFMFPGWFLPIGRPGIALCGGLTMIVWRYVLQKAGHGPYFDAERVIIFEPLFLLFGLMLTTIYMEKMERGGLFDRLRVFLDDPLNWKRAAKIMTVSTIGAAAFMNDSVVLIFSGVVVFMCRRHRVSNSLPYLLSLATAANIGSALTMTGNPQNILIVSLAYDRIGWLEFACNMILPVLASSFINAALLVVYFRRELFPGSSGLIVCLNIMFRGHRTPEMLAQEHTFHARYASSTNPNDLQRGWSFWSILQTVIVILFLSCFAAGLDVCAVSLCTGAILMLISSYKRQHFDRRYYYYSQFDDEGYLLPQKIMYDMYGNQIEPEDVDLATESETTLTEVDYGLLILFIGQFLLIGSFDDTGVPQSVFNFLMGKCAWQMANGPCVYWFALIVTILSNIASNVPVCQMLAATFPYATPYEWLHVAFSATIAGNLTMLGSAANMIVAFQASRAGDRSFTPGRHALFGVPSTLLCLYAGTLLLATFHVSPDCSVKLGTCPQ